jgi:transcriptional regulator with XRE-family HTH domain
LSRADISERSRGNHFANRLTELCKTKSSVSAVARDLGINRQQFARYISGESLPRQAIHQKIADYFGVDPGELHSDRPIKERKAASMTASSTVKAMMLLLDASVVQPISNSDLEPGFYWQYKLLLRMPGKVVKSLVMITNDDGVYRYKRRSSVVYNAQLNGTVKNTFNGVFFKQNGYLVMTDVGDTLNDLTFHVFATRHVYDTSIKPGLHMTIGLSGSFGPKSARLFLKKIPDDESILAHARKQGVVNITDLPEGYAHILEGNDLEGSGIMQL